jgi:hypothetical protein
LSAQAVLKDAADRGVCVSLNGDNLAFKATVRPPPELLANLKMHKAEIVALLRNEAAHPKPRIVREPPFGSDSVPERFIAAWQALISHRPLGVDVYAWEAAIYDGAALFGDFGKLLDDYRWTPNDLFAVPRDGRPGGLAWFIKGSPVTALGRVIAQTQDGRIFHKPER